ncbi:MAG: PIN domain-containing protein [Arcicella sp.]|nr:PIN domain-containing protein [Arcicella sp.]
MKRFIIDANILFSMFISGKEEYIELTEKVKFLTPVFALEELQKHQEMILSKTKIDLGEFNEFTLRILGGVLAVPNFLVTTQSYLQAYNWCKDIDLDDMAYIALSIEFDTCFVTRDMILYEGLKQKDYQNIMTWKDFLEEYL